MSNGVVLSSPNALLGSSGTLLAALRDPAAELILLALGELTVGSGVQVNDASSQEEIRSALGLPADTVAGSIEALLRADLISTAGDRYRPTARGWRWIVRVGTDLGRLAGEAIGGSLEDLEGGLQSTYHLTEELGRGGTSVTFLATQDVTHGERAVKVIYPGYASLDELGSALAKRQAVRNPVIPAVLDAGLLQGSRFGFLGNPLCVVQECVRGNARTFEDFLRSDFYSPSHLIGRFIEEVGGAIAAIAAVGLEHGDLHSRNILVSDDENREPQFHVIDFVGLSLGSSPNTQDVSDDDYFMQHLLRAVVIAHDRDPELPLRRLLGERVWRVVDAVQGGRIQSASAAVDLLHTALPAPLPIFKAAQPRPFEWLRVESMPAPRDLVELFEPSVGRFEEVKQFGNMWISGPRGSGKSHYVRVLAFYPDLERLRLNGDEDVQSQYERLGLDFRQQFGILIPCRVGSFKAFSPEVLGGDHFDTNAVIALKDMLILTIMSHALISLVAGCLRDGESEDQSPLGYPADLSRLAELWGQRSRGGPLLPGSPLGKLEQIQEEVSQELLKARASWHRGLDEECEYLDEHHLDQFFTAVSGTFAALSGARFQIIFDDVTHGIVHLELQKVINSLVRSAGDRHCFKITCEKYQYTLDSSDGRAIEFPHDAEFCDLGELAVGTNKAAPSRYRQYLAAVVDRRLSFGGWDRAIGDIVGRSQPPRVFLQGLRAQGSTGDADPNAALARYAGWNILCHLSHGSIRSLLEMLEHIFTVAGGTEAALSMSPIDSVDQDAALREYSLRHWQELQNLPGRTGDILIGPHLKALASALGEMSRRLLLYYPSAEPYEALSIERLDPGRPLSPDAETILEAALRYGVLVETGAGFSRAHRGLQARLDLNKMFTPAFRTTYRVRNHIYLSGLEFEELLLRPSDLAKRRNARPAPRTPQDELPL